MHDFNRKEKWLSSLQVDHRTVDDNCISSNILNGDRR